MKPTLNFFFDRFLSTTLIPPPRAHLPRKSADAAPKPPAAAMCPRCSPGCCISGLGDAGLGLGARMLSIVNRELALVVAVAAPRLNTGRKPSPRTMLPSSGRWLGCADVSTILKSSSLYVSSATSHHSRSLSRLTVASFPAFVRRQWRTGTREACVRGC